MKKIFPILLCALLACALVFSVSAEGSSVAITPSATTLERGDTFTIVADLTNSDPIKLGTVVVEYDTNVFELTGGTCHVANAAIGVVKPEQKVGTFFLGAETVVSGRIFTFNFKVKDNAAFGTYTFTPTASIGEDAKIPATGTTITVACSHTYGAWTKVDDSKHQQVCSKCGDKKEEEHDWNDGEGKPAPTCTAPGTIEYTCLICQTKRTENAGQLEHVWDNACDTTCNRGCGTTREVSHNYVLVNTDPEAHWYQCDCGELKGGSWEKHTPGPEATATSAQLCTVCNYEIKPAIAHTHVLEKEWTTDSNYHWHRCETRNPSCYYVADKAKHDYDNDCDVSCNTCGYIREAPHKYKPEWQGNAEGHWQICADCNAKSQIFEHVPGPEATMDTPQTCKECNFVIKMELSHVHNYGDTWYSDDESHWQSCVDCPESTPIEPHEWDEGVELADGKMQYTCSVCEKQLVTDEPMETQPSTVPTTLPATQKPTEPSDSGRFPWQWAGIAAIVLLVIGVVLLVIEFIRSRKSNMHGKFSK